MSVQDDILNNQSPNSMGGVDPVRLQNVSSDTVAYQSDNADVEIFSNEDLNASGASKNDVKFVQINNYEQDEVNVIHTVNKTYNYETVNLVADKVDINVDYEVNVNKQLDLNQNADVGVSTGVLFDNSKKITVVTNDATTQENAARGFAEGITSVISLPSGFVTGNIRGRVAGYLKNRRESAEKKLIGVEVYVDDVKFRVDRVEFKTFDTNPELSSKKVSQVRFYSPLVWDDTTYFTNKNPKILYNIVNSSNPSHKILIDYYVNDASGVGYFTSKKNLISILIDSAFLTCFSIRAKGAEAVSDGFVFKFKELLFADMSDGSYETVLDFQYVDIQGSASSYANVKFLLDTERKEALSGKKQAVK